MVLAEDLGIGGRRLPQIVERAGVLLLAERRGGAARNVDDRLEGIRFENVEIGREIRFEGQSPHGLHFERGRREEPHLRSAAVHRFELGDGIHDVGAGDARRHIGRRSDAAVFGFALVVVDDVALGVAVIHRSRRGEPHGAQNRSGVGAVDFALSVQVFERNMLRNLQPFGRPEVRMEFCAQRFAPGIHDRTLLLVVGHRKNRRNLFRSAAERDAVVLRHARPENLVEPVGTCHVRTGVHLRIGQIGQRAVHRVADGLGPYVAVLPGIEHVRQIHRLLDTDRGIHVHAHLARLGLPGGDQDDATRSDRRTVNGRRCRILQDRHRLYVLDRVGSVGNAVHDDQHAVARGRIVIVAFRAASADGERRLAHRVAARLQDRHARHAALEQGSEVCGAAARPLVHLDRRNGHRKVLLALGAVTDGDHLADHHGILLQRNVDLRAVRHRNALRFIAYEREIQRGVLRHGDLVAAVHIGRNTVGRAALYDRSADKRILTGIGQAARNRDTVLSLGRKNEHATQQAHQKKTDDPPSLPRKSQIHFHKVKVNN